MTATMPAHDPRPPEDRTTGSSRLVVNTPRQPRSQDLLIIAMCTLCTAVSLFCLLMVIQGYMLATNSGTSLFNGFMLLLIGSACFYWSLYTWKQLWRR